MDRPEHGATKEDKQLTNTLILGTGRSGTSLVTSLFRNSGHYIGDDYIKPRRANQYGFFEDSEINNLNNLLLARRLMTHYTKKLPSYLRHGIYTDHRALWLAAPPFLLPRRITNEEADRMWERVAHQPFCYKDPRFSMTLPLWWPYLPDDTRFIVVFRHPDQTIESMLREAETRRPPIQMNRRYAYRCWYRMYSRLLVAHARRGPWMFVHYKDVLDNSVLPAMSAFTGAALDAELVDPSVSRSRRAVTRGGDEVSQCERLFAKLLNRAAEDQQTWGRKVEAVDAPKAMENQVA